MVSTADGITTPDAGDQYALTADLAATGATIQTAIDLRSGHEGTTTERNNFTASGRDGVTWYDTTAQALYALTGGAWVRIAPPSDTGWVNLSNFGGNASAGDPAPAYRVIGGTVYFRGRINSTGGSGVFNGQQFATVPASVRPEVNMTYGLPGTAGINNGAGATMMRGTVRTDGVITVSQGAFGDHILLDPISYPLG